MDEYCRLSPLTVVDRVIAVFRDGHPCIVKLWKSAAFQVCRHIKASGTIMEGLPTHSDAADSMLMDPLSILYSLQPGAI